MPFQFTCERCGVVFTVPQRNRPNRFCSQACQFAPRPCEVRNDGTIAVPLAGGQVAIVDAEDAGTVTPFNWFLSSKKYAVRSRRAADGPGGKYVFMHRVIADTPPGMHTDHIDGNTFNNRRSNLRAVTCSQNLANRGVQANSTTGYSGVCFDKKLNRWMAGIKFQGRRRFLGRFDTPEEAAMAYDNAARELFGEFARTNF